MNTHDMTELPPLPDAEAYLYICGEHRGVSLNYRGDADLSEGTRRIALITAEQADDRARAAIEADRKRRDKPIGYIMPTALKQLKAGGNAIVGGVSQGCDVPLYADPQQVVPLSDERIRLIWKETRARMGVGGDPVLWFARAIERALGISAPQPAESCASLISDKTACGSENGDCDSQRAESTFTTPDCPRCGCVQDGQCLCNPSRPSTEPVTVPSDDVLADALTNLEHDNYEQSYSGYKNRQADVELIRAALAAMGERK